MRTYRLSFTLFVALVCSLSVLGQERQRLPDPSNYPVRTKYDRFDDKTSVTLSLTDVQGTMFDGLAMGALSVYEGEKLKTPVKEVVLLVASTSEDWRFQEGSPRTLRVIADGKRLNLGELRRSSTKVGSGYVTEHMNVVVPIETFNTIAKAKKVEMQLGRIEFELSGEFLSLLKDFSGRLVP